MSLAFLNRDATPPLTDHQLYRLLFAATFVVFLGAALLMRVFRLVRGNPRTFGTRPSLFAEAKAAGYSTLALAFMG